MAVVHEFPCIGLLLAAGSSQRFGGDKRWHRLADGSPMALATARTLKAAQLPSLAVLRPEDTTLAERLQSAGLEIAINDDPTAGLGSSIACGVKASVNANGWLIVLADMPYVQVATIRQVAACLAAGARIAAPVHAGQRGHPVGFAHEFGPALRQLKGEPGARVILQQQAGYLVTVPVNDPGILIDVDYHEPTGPAS